MECFDLMLMDTRANPLAAGGPIVRLAKNAECPGPRRMRKRLGFSADVGTDQAIGGSAPFELLTWKYGTTTALIEYGAGSIAIVNPVNGYLYSRVAALTTDRIWSAVNTAAATAWGLAAPTIGTLASGISAGASVLSVGQYKLAITAYDQTRRCESPPTFVSSASAASPWQPSNAVQGVPSPAYSISFTGGATLASGASHGRLYVKRLMGLAMSGPIQTWGWRPTDALGLLNLRQVEEKAAGAGWAPSTYTGSAPEGGILDYASAVVPYGECAIWHDGRTFWGGGTLAGACGPNTIVYSNPACPETYCGTITVSGQSVTPTMAYDENRGIVQALGTIDLPASAGNIVALVSFNDRLLALCRRGCWEITRSPDGIGYGYSEDMLAVGCVSRATVAYSAFGVLWLSHQGVILWDGSSAPKAISQPVLDPTHANLDFAASMTTACAAFDHQNERYIVAYPTSAGGQNILNLEIGLWLRGYPAWSRWILGSGTVNGLGWDGTNRRVLMRVGSTWYAQTTAYADSGGSFTFGPTFLFADPDGRVLANPEVRVVPLRANSGVAQTVTVTVQGMPTADESAASGPAVVAAWGGGTAYAVDALVRPVAGSAGYRYRCTTAGTSGAAEPAWPTTVGNTVTDGTAPSQITWTCEREAFLLDWAINGVRSEATGRVSTSGRVLKVSVENTDAYPLELSAVGLVATPQGPGRTDD